MITFPSILGANGLPLVIQALTHRAVYLDTWALQRATARSASAFARRCWAPREHCCCPTWVSRTPKSEVHQWKQLLL